MARRTLFIIAATASLTLLFLGAWRGEFREIWFNGSTL